VPDPAPRSKRRRRWLRALIVLLASAGLLEIGLRLALFSGGPGGTFSALREPELYTRHWSAEHYVLRHVLTGAKRQGPTRHDPRLGWTHRRFAKGTYDHSERSRVQGRRPVLLFGDSFAACVTPPGDCWQGLLEESPLGRELCMLNYGVDGYGFDQACLLLHETLDLWDASRPIVVVSLLVGADMDRAALPFFYRPKPDWVIDAQGHAHVRGPVAEDIDAWVEAHGIGIRSYALGWLLHGSGLLPEAWVAALAGERAHEARVRALTRSLLDDLQAELDGRGVEWFVMIFHGMRYFRTDVQGFADADWREPFLLRELDERGIRHVSSRGELAAAVSGNDDDLFDYYIREGPGRRHYTPLGNRVVFEALRRGLEGGSDGSTSPR